MKAVRRKLAAWALCALLAVGVLFSAWFLVQEIRHTCTGSGCPVCAGVQAAAQRLKSGAHPSAAIMTAPVLHRAAPAAGGPVRTRPVRTLVEHKVRLDN